MKNIEKYEQEISKLVNKGKSLSCAIAIAAGIRNGNCFGCKCSDCYKKCLEWMHSEYNEPILSDDEKDIVKAMIDFAHKCGVDVIDVCKFQNKTNGVYIYCEYKYKENKDVIASPWLPKNMFKGMEPERGYTLEKLGISCPKQKDNYVRQ